MKPSLPVCDNTLQLHFQEKRLSASEFIPKKLSFCMNF